jgi:hypothetical protein
MQFLPGFLGPSSTTFARYAKFLTVGHHLLKRLPISEADMYTSHQYFAFEDLRQRTRGLKFAEFHFDAASVGLFACNRLFAAREEEACLLR